MNTNTANRRSKRSSGNPYVFVSYDTSYNAGYVAVVDSRQNELIQRIPVGIKPGPMCLNYQEDKLYVVNIDQDFITIIDAYTFEIIKTVHIGGPSAKSAPVAIFAAAKVNKVYVAHSGDRAVTIIDSVTDKVIKQVDLPSGSGYPFAFAGHPNSNYVFVACRAKDNDNGNVVAISYLDDSAYPVGDGIELTFDGSRNPLTVHPDGHTQVTFGPAGMLTYFDNEFIGSSSTSSLLDNTISGVYTDDKRLFCTLREDKNYLKIISNLAINKNGIVTYKSFADFSSYKGQDKIRLSRTQAYIGITVQPTDSPRGGVQIIDLNEGFSHLVELDYVGDLAFLDDSTAYVGEVTSITPIDLATATALPGIFLGTNFMDLFTVKNIVIGYSNQS
ncbi:hypothetical protein MHH28_12565 [Paenibacillus sp. FSL K6-1217]|uniref:YncE family protein n=1 Tax=Paenibacillus sp. FSL K6-1217 TaxID=2921466 RepID=UPI0032465FB0